MSTPWLACRGYASTTCGTRRPACCWVREPIPKVVQEMLGHSAVVFTLDIYSHVTPGLQEDAAGRMQSRFEQS